jgi:hypothetical protein
VNDDEDVPMTGTGDWARLLAGTATEGAGRPRRICTLCVEQLDVTGAGISMVTAAGNRGVVCATDEVSARIEELQFMLGEGPAFDAVRSGAPALVPDLGEPDDVTAAQWPAFTEGATAAGVRALFAFPLRIGVIGVGALDLYRDRRGGLDGDQLTAASMAADVAALALLDLDVGRDDLFADDFDARATFQLQVHQATGMIQIQLGVTTEQAFAMLRARAFATGLPVVAVATDVVERRLRFSEEDR